MDDAAVISPSKPALHRSPTDGMSSRHLYVHHLPPATTEDALRSLFIPYGDLADLHLPLQPASSANRGYAFVSFEQPDDAKHAQLNLDKAQFLGMVIRVKSTAARRHADPLHASSSS